MVRSPVEICLGKSPSQAAESRPFANASPLPMAATIALEMLGPIPGTLISRSQPASRRAMASISPDKPSMRSSSRRQSPAKSSMTCTMRGDRTSGGVVSMRGNSARKKRCPCRTATPSSNRKADVALQVRARPSRGFAQSVCLHLRLEPRHVVAENDQVVLDPGAVPDVIAQQGLGSETHALEHRDGSALVDRHLCGQFLQAEPERDSEGFLDQQSADSLAPHVRGDDDADLADVRRPGEYLAGDGRAADQRFGAD